MNLQGRVVYVDDDSGDYLCFKHTVKRTINGAQIISDVEIYSPAENEYDLRDLSCVDCNKK